MKKTLFCLSFVLLFCFGFTDIISADNNSTKTVRAVLTLDVDDFIDEEDVEIIEENDEHYLVVETEDGKEVRHKIGKEDAEKILITKEIETNKNDSETGIVKEVEGKKLPKTATNMFNYMTIGLLMLGLGLILYVFNRKVKKKSGDDGGNA